MAAPRKWFLNPMIAEGFGVGNNQGTLANANPMPPPSDTAGVPPGTPIDTLGNQGSGYTGFGAPSQTAGQVEKGEWVFSAPATQALGPDTLQAMKQKVDSGQLNAQTVNTIRQAVGLAPLRSFQDGTDENTFRQNIGEGQTPRVFDQGNSYTEDMSRRNDVLAGKTTAANDTAIANTNSYNASMAERADLLANKANAATTSNTNAYNTLMSGRSDVLANKGNAANVANANKANFLANRDPITGSYTGVGAGTYGGGTQYKGMDPQAAIDLAKRQAEPGYRPGTTSDFYRNIGMGGLASIAAGKSPYFETLQEMQQRRLAGQGAAQEAALRQELAQGGVGGGVARSAMGEQTRDISGQMAEARATTTAEQMKQAEQATGELASQGLAGQNLAEDQRQADITQGNWKQQFEEGKRQFNVGMQQEALDIAMTAGDFDSYTKGVKELYGIDVDPSVMQDSYNRGIFNQGLTALDDVLLRDPNATMDSVGAKNALETMWRGEGNTGPMDEAWANRTMASMRVSSSPIVRAMNSISEDDARSLFGDEPGDVGSNIIDKMTYKVGDKVLTGYDAFKTAWGTAQLTGGVSYDADKGTFDVKSWTNPAVAAIFGSGTGAGGVGAVPPSNITDSWDKTKTYHEFEGNNYKYDSATNTWSAYSGVVPQTTYTKDGNTLGVTANANVPGGYVSSNGMPIKYDETTGIPHEYDYANYKKDSGGTVTDINALNTYVQLGDTGAMSDYYEKFKTDPTILRGIDKTDNRYKAVLEGAKTVKTARPGDWIADYANDLVQLKYYDSIVQVLKGVDGVVRYYSPHTKRYEPITYFPQTMRPALETYGKA